MWTKALFVSVLLAAGVAYLLYIPYPEECDFPLGVRIAYTIVQATYHAGSMVAAFGGNYWEPYRLIQVDTNFSMDSIEMKKETFAGVKVAFMKPRGYSEKAPGAAMVYFHGGGWTIGSIASHSQLVIRMADKLGMLIVMPEYRLAPEHPFPMSFVDSLAVTKEFIIRAAEFNVDPKKIVVSGDSAGGNLAMAIGLYLSEYTPPDGTKLPEICMLNLIYPVVQMSNFQLPSYLQNQNPPMLPPHVMARFFLTYMGLLNHSDLIDPMLHNLHMEGYTDKDVLQRTSDAWVPEKYRKRPLKQGQYQPSPGVKETLEKYKPMMQQLAANTIFSPLAASDAELRKLPATHVVTCEFDVLRDDGIILYERMKSLDLKVSLQHLSFGAHGLFKFYGVDYKKLNDEMDDMLKTIRTSIEQC